MKLHKFLGYLYLYVYIPITIISISAIILGKQYFLTALIPFNILFFIVALLIIVSPLGNLSFDKQIITNSVIIKKFLWIVLFEIAFIIVNSGIHQSVYALTNTPIQLMSGTFLPTNILQKWQTLSLYPWTIFALMGAALAWSRAQSHENSVTWGNSLTPLLHKYLTENFIITVDYLYRTGFIWTLIITFAIAILHTAQILANALHIKLVIGFTFSNFFIAIIILNIIYRHKTFAFLRYLLNKDISFGRILLLFTTILILLLLLLNTITNSIVSYLGLSQYSAQIPAWLKSLYTNHYDVIIFSWAWPLSMASTMGFCFARIAKGLSIRIFLLMVLVLPAVVQIYSLFLMHNHSFFITPFIEKYAGILSNAKTLPFISLGLLIMLFMPKQGLNGFMRLTLEQNVLDKRQVPTNLVRGFIYVITLLTLSSYLGLLSLLLIVTAILIVPYIVISWMSIIASVLDIMNKRKNIVK